MPWECKICTLLNLDDDGGSCDLCGAPKGATDRESVKFGGSNLTKRLSTMTGETHLSFASVLRAGPDLFKQELENEKALAAAASSSSNNNSNNNNNSSSSSNNNNNNKGGKPTSPTAATSKEKEKSKAVKQGCFGIPLQSQAPPVLCDCIAYITQNGMHTEGIFRIPGQQDMVDFLRAEYEKNPDGDIIGEHKSKLEVHDVATLFKTYFRMLPTPLVPLNHYQSLMQSVRIKHNTREDLIQAVSDVAHGLPSPERECFGMIITFLKRLAMHSESNKMTPANLATCFAPSLIRAPDNIRPEQALNDMSAAIGALNILIQNPEDLPQPDLALIRANTHYKAGGMVAPPPGMGMFSAPPGL